MVAEHRDQDSQTPWPAWAIAATPAPTRAVAPASCGYQSCAAGSREAARSAARQDRSKLAISPARLYQANELAPSYTNPCRPTQPCQGSSPEPISSLPWRIPDRRELNQCGEGEQPNMVFDRGPRQVARFLVSSYWRSTPLTQVVRNVGSRPDPDSRTARSCWRRSPRLRDAEEYRSAEPFRDKFNDAEALMPYARVMMEHLAPRRLRMWMIRDVEHWQADQLPPTPNSIRSSAADEAARVGAAKDGVSGDMIAVPEEVSLSLKLRAT